MTRFQESNTSNLHCGEKRGKSLRSACSNRRPAHGMRESVRRTPLASVTLYTERTKYGNKCGAGASKAHAALPSG
jgi:hypothetical protein